MTERRHWLLLPAAALLAWLAACAAPPVVDLDAGEAMVAGAAWSRRSLADGVTLRTAAFAALFGAPQSVQVLDVDLRRPGVRIDVAVPPARTRTSELGAAAGAVAAVNGGFFEPDGAPRGLRRGGGVLRSLPPGRVQATVGFGADGSVRFGDATADDWSAFPAAVGAGPMLLVDGIVVDPGERQRGVRHPRTAVGVDAQQVLHFVVVDGRAAEAAGASFEELAHLLRGLGCRTAINLDGGGSSTLWVRGLPDGGIANHPCDDRVFDAAGERAVSDAVLVFAPRMSSGR